MRELIATLTNAGVLGVPGVPSLKSVTYGRCSSVPVGVPGVLQRGEEHVAHRAEHLPSPLKILKLQEEHAEHPEHVKNRIPAQDCPDAWQAALARLDEVKPALGVTPTRWRELVTDARWLADRHGGNAATLGWTASNLFGLDETLDGWGGVADRLRGTRRATFTDTVAHWRSDELDEWLWRRSLRRMRLIWQAPGAMEA